MKKLSYETLKEQGYDGYLLESAPERVLQFGEGNFLRAFADYFIDELNEKAGFNSKELYCASPSHRALPTLSMNRKVSIPYFCGASAMGKRSIKSALSPVSAAV